MIKYYRNNREDLGGILIFSYDEKTKMVDIIKSEWRNMKLGRLHSNKEAWFDSLDEEISASEAFAEIL